MKAKTEAIFAALLCNTFKTMGSAHSRNTSCCNSRGVKFPILTHLLEQRGCGLVHSAWRSMQPVLWNNEITVSREFSYLPQVYVPCIGRQCCRK